MIQKKAEQYAQQENINILKYIKQGTRVTCYSSVGSKITGELKSVNTFEIVLIVDQKNVIVFKGNIFYIEVCK